MTRFQCLTKFHILVIRFRGARPTWFSGQQLVIRRASTSWRWWGHSHAAQAYRTTDSAAWTWTTLHSETAGIFQITSSGLYDYRVSNARKGRRKGCYGPFIRLLLGTSQYTQFLFTAFWVNYTVLVVMSHILLHWIFHCCWMDRGSIEWAVCPILTHD